jgi:hypothetical protein
VTGVDDMGCRLYVAGGWAIIRAGANGGGLCLWQEFAEDSDQGRDELVLVAAHWARTNNRSLIVDESCGR